MQQGRYLFLLSRLNLIVGILLILGPIVSIVPLPIKVDHRFNIGGYAMVIDTILAPLSILSYVFVLSLDPKSAIRWWRILLMIFPLLYVWATIGDIHSQNLTLKDLLNPNTPVFYKLSK